MVHSLADSCYIYAGMDGAVVGVDIDKLENMAKRRGIDLVRYHFFTSFYANKLSEYIGRMRNKK